MNKINLAIADDNEKYRNQIVKLLRDSNQIDIDVIIQAQHGEDLLRQLEKIRPHIILMDIRMPVMDGIQATRIIRDRYPDVKIIVVTLFAFEDHILMLNRLGVKSFVGKNQIELLETSIRVVHEGNVFFPSEIANTIQKHLPDDIIGRRRNSLYEFRLSDFELYLLRLICDGMSSVDIGHATKRSPRTIEDYRDRLYKKFSVQSKEQLIVQAIRKNFV